MGAAAPTTRFYKVAICALCLTASNTGNNPYPSEVPISSTDMVSQKSSLLKAAATDHGYPWQPGAWARLPWLGLLALIGALLCICGAAAVLRLCDGQPIDDWPVQPPVYLAILSTFTNAFLRFAFAEGVTISWWTKALHTNSIRNLHYNWSYGNSLWSILTSRRPFNLIRLAGFIVTFVVIDGPLLQRASVPVASVRESSVSLVVPISPGPFVQGATGILAYTGNRPDFFTPAFRRVVLEQGEQSNITLSSTGCKGVCETDILAAGFDISCERGHIATTLPLDDAIGPTIHDPAYENSTVFEIVDLNSTVFSINVQFIGGSGSDRTPTPAHMIVTALFKEDPAPNGGLTNHTCTFREAIIQYPIRISNDTVSLRDQELPGISIETNTTKQLIGRPTELGASAGTVGSTLGGIYLAVLDQFNTTTIARPNLGRYQYYNEGSAGRRYFDFEETIWPNPMPDIITFLWGLSFRTAVQSSGEEVSDYDMNGYPFGQSSSGYDTFISNQTVEAGQRESIIVFSSNYSYLGGALAVMLLSTFTIIPTFYGWWLHGRVMSLSPIEIAKAFNAPFFQEVSSNATADQVLDIMSQRKVCYGVRQDQELMRRGGSGRSVSYLTATEGRAIAQPDADGGLNSDRAGADGDRNSDRADADGDHSSDRADADGDCNSDRADADEGQFVEIADAGEDHSRDIVGDAEEHFLAPSSRSEGKALPVHVSQQPLYNDGNGAGRSMRLEIMDALHARRPRKGEVYF